MDSDGELLAPPKRRPFCPRCSKPMRVCLCARLTGPSVDNVVGVTVLQHTREKDHPLNSTRVAALGLRNLDVVPISDVNFHAEFVVVPLPNPGEPKANRDISGCGCTEEATKKRSEAPGFPEAPPPPPNTASGAKANCGNCRKAGRNCSASCSPDSIHISIERDARPDLGWVHSTPAGTAAASRGFTVQKIQTRTSTCEQGKLQVFVEFDIQAPPGSALLFPGKASVALDEAAARDLNVKHLFVLDGTWAKARRMYYENPWLQLLPRVRLETEEESLYREVRHQPKAGCLSTIESIVLALKVLAAGGGEPERLNGLDGLLEVFASMIRDQTELKEERFEKMALLRELDRDGSLSQDEAAQVAEDK